MYYFAYGSNMNHKQMKKRCPSCKFVKKVFLKEYKFLYDGYSKCRKGAVANIIESKSDIVWGGLFEINEDNLAALDCYEGYPTSYKKKKVRVEDEHGEICLAWTYLREGKDLSKPSEDYRNIVVQGAHYCNLSEEYIKSVLLK